MATDRNSVEIQIRRLARTCRSAALATASADQNGHPVVSLVTTACAFNGAPVLLLSDLADHSKNLRADPRASLLFEQASRRKNPQTGPRATFIGTLHPAKGDSPRNRFLARHPSAAAYAGFSDFRFYEMSVTTVHFVGGFARAIHLSGDQVLLAGKWQKLFEQESRFLSSINENPARLSQMASRLKGKKGKGWQAVGVDPDGIDLCNTRSHCRLDFEMVLRKTKDFEPAFMQLLRQFEIQP